MQEANAREVFAELVGQRLRALREARGLTMEHAAMLADVSPTLVSQVEAGIQSPRGDSLVRMLAVYGAALDDVAGDYYEMYRERGASFATLFRETRPSKLLARRDGSLPDAASGRVRGSTSSRRSSAASSDLNAPAGAAAKKKAGEQQRRRSGDRSREGGI